MIENYISNYDLFHMIVEMTEALTCIDILALFIQLGSVSESVLYPVLQSKHVVLQLSLYHLMCGSYNYYYQHVIIPVQVIISQ